MAELGAATDPRRAALLKKAVAQSKDELIAVRLDRLVDLLDKDQLSRALENQTEVDRDLRGLLELLMSENRAKRIESEKARIREYLKRISGLIKQQKDIQGRTAGGDDPKRLSGEQGKVAEKTGQLAADVKKNEGRRGTGGGRRGTGNARSKRARRVVAVHRHRRQPATLAAQSQDQPPGAGSTLKRLDTAQKRMIEAEDKLKEAQRHGAGEKQEQAIRELQLAKAKLEEILRQLREEEIGRMLANARGAIPPDAGPAGGSL